MHPLSLVWCRFHQLFPITTGFFQVFFLVSVFHPALRVSTFALFSTNTLHFLLSVILLAGDSISLAGISTSVWCWLTMVVVLLPVAVTWIIIILFRSDLVDFFFDDYDLSESVRWIFVIFTMSFGWYRIVWSLLNCSFGKAESFRGYFLRRSWLLRQKR